MCKANINVSLDATGTATITPANLLQSASGCSNDFEVDITDTLSSHYGNTVNADLLGMPLVATLTHVPSGNNCSTNVTVIDDLSPLLDCDTLFIWCNQPSEPDSIGFPAVSDNATDTVDIELSWEDVFTDLDCFDTITLGDTFYVATALIERTWIAMDESGNESSCTQFIYFKRATLDMVQFPKHLDGVQAPALECAVDDPDSLELTGQPAIEGLVLDNTANCELIVSHSDQQIPVCGGARKIIRTWTVFDLCTTDFKVFSQIIKVNDTTKPVLTCPSNASFSAYTSNCSAQVWLPQASATDACSGATVTPSWQFGSGYGPFNTVPVGTYTATYTAKDGCNNTSTCEITVTVKDETKPTALCQNLVNVALQTDGTAIIYASSFNNGSHDNCGIDHLLVSRDGQPYDEFIYFDCEDLGAQVQVTLKVVDVHGLESQCVSHVTVKDEIVPGIICPPTITFSCGQNYNNPAQTGIPYATDNCTVASTTFTNQINLNSCGIGTVLRTWKATDESGNFTTCQQTINITDDTPISITFPPDLVTYECEPNTDTAVTGIPVVIGKDCEQLQVSHTDYYFYTAEPACYKLIRKWAIINWCVYQPNDPDETGFWEHTQVIEVRDSIAPALTCPADITVGIQNTGCQTVVQLPQPQVDDCSNQVSLTVTSPFPNGIYPKGTHTITYVAADGCGNTSACSFKLKVADAQAPSPVCNNGVSVTIQQNGYVTVTPSMINNGSFDNCTAASGLVLQVSPNTFDCNSLGSKTVTLTVTDEAGNSAFCQTTVVVQDNFNVCNNQTTATIAGKLTKESGEPVSQKLVGLSGGLAIAVHTDVDGTFDFPNLPLGQTYTLTPSYNTKPLNGVTTYDMVLIRRHILGVEALGSPYKIIAADANRSNSVSTLDLVDMQKLILNVTTSFPNNNPSWRFVPSAYAFPIPANPFSQPFPETITLPNIQSNKWDQDFISIKVGDVNGSANPAGLNGDEEEDRSFSFGDELIFKIEDKELHAGTEYEIPFLAKDFSEIAGFQFTIDFNKNALELISVKPGALATLKEQNFGKTFSGEGLITASWDNFTNEQLFDGETIFTLRFFAKRNTQLSEALAVNSRLTPAEAYRGRLNEPGNNFELMGVNLLFDKATTEQFRLFQNAPNPFREKTKAGFYLPESTMVTLRIYDVYGRLLKHYEGSFPKGDNQIEVDMSGIPAAGILLCELQAAGFQKQTVLMINDE